jgi:hypothetical protein
VPGHLAIARDNITRVLCKKLGERYFSEADAVKIARMLLRDNAGHLFRLKLGK